MDRMQKLAKVTDIVASHFDKIAEVDCDGDWVSVDGVPSYFTTYTIEDLEKQGLIFHGTAPVGEYTTYYFKLCKAF